jgi:hypothetical protein
MSTSSVNLDDHWYYATDSGHAGPVTAMVIQDLLHKGVVTKGTLVWNSSFGQSWKPIRDIDFGLPKPPPLPKGNLIIRALEVFAHVVRWAIYLLIVAGAVWWYNLPESPQQKAADARAMTIAQNAISGLRQSGWQPTWDAIEIKEAKRDRYEFLIKYKYSPGTYDAADADTRSVIRAALAETMTAGLVPADALTNGIMVFTEQKVSGETGTPLYRDFGHAFYNPLRDQIKFTHP